MSTTVYGCHDRDEFRDYYLPTGAPDLPQYRIPHAMTTDCQYRHTDLGKSDQACEGCKHREQHDKR